MGVTLSKEQKAVRDVFTGCADFVEEGEYDDSIGECVDQSIISEEEGGFRLTELGEEAQARGEEFDVRLPDGTILRLDPT